MPIPLLFLLPCVASFIVFWLTFKLLRSLIIKVFAGKKRIVCLGPPVSGKTTFIEFMLHGKITEVYKGTHPKELKKGKIISMGNLNIRIPDFNDLYGSDLNYQNWRDEFSNADICFYLLNICEWKINVSYKERVNNDLSRISSWCEKADKKPLILFLFNFCDQLPEYKPGHPKALQDVLIKDFKEYHDEMRLKIECQSRAEYIICSMHKKYIQNSFLYILGVVAGLIKKAKK